MTDFFLTKNTCKFILHISLFMLLNFITLFELEQICYNQKTHCLGISRHSWQLLKDYRFVTDVHIGLVAGLSSLLYLAISFNL